jgi:hypothetical protein
MGKRKKCGQWRRCRNRPRAPCAGRVNGLSLYISGRRWDRPSSLVSVMPRQTLAGVVVNAGLEGRRFAASTNSTRAWSCPITFTRSSNGTPQCPPSWDGSKREPCRGSSAGWLTDDTTRSSVPLWPDQNVETPGDGCAGGFSNPPQINNLPHRAVAATAKVREPCPRK